MEKNSEFLVALNKHMKGHHNIVLKRAGNRYRKMVTVPDTIHNIVVKRLDSRK